MNNKLKFTSYSFDEHSLLSLHLWKLENKPCFLTWTLQIYFIISGIHKSTLGIFFFYQKKKVLAEVKRQMKLKKHAHGDTQMLRVHGEWFSSIKHWGG